MGNVFEETYVTPPGYADYPFCYVFDATSLTDGNDYEDIQQALQGDSQFILRHIAGVPSCVDTAAGGGRFNYKNASRSYCFSPGAGVVMPKNFPVVPEKLYDRNASIYLDLFNVLRENAACTGVPVYRSFIGFFGIKRFPVNAGYPIQQTPYKYKEKRYSYEFPLTISQGRYTTAASTDVTPAQRCVQELDNFDFELCQISISAEDATGALAGQEFAITLYDPNMHMLSSAPVPQGWINAGRPTARTQAPYQGLFPVPSVVYPAGGNIVFDVTSLLCVTDVPKTYNVSLLGMWRVPCG